ncbi:MAG: universal stress protein [Halobacteria archaeon]|nr:universal stress protein [Halobacteria archaeon]
MYDEILFPVSFYLLDESELREHGCAVAKRFDASLHLLSVVLEDENQSDIDEHKQAFTSFASDIEEEGIEVTTELREDPSGYDTVADTIAEESRDYDMVLMGHTKVSERRGSEWTTADKVINAASVPVFVVPLHLPRFRDV